MPELALPQGPGSRIRSALGWLGLENWKEAAGELHGIEPAWKQHRDVLAAWLMVHGAASQWQQMREVAAALQEREPLEAQWVISRAYATRRAESIGAARTILLAAREQFPHEAVIFYNLACYDAQTGDLASARTLLQMAIQMDEQYREMALQDPDLAPLRGGG